MPMSEYELSLVNEAKKGKKKSFERLCDSVHKQLVEVIEGELYSRDKAETIIKKVTAKAKAEIQMIRNPADFEWMIINLTIAECANYPRGASDGQGGGTAATSFSEQKNDRAQAQMNRSDDRNNWNQAPASREPEQRNNWNQAPAPREPEQRNNWNQVPASREPEQRNNWNQAPARREPEQRNNWNQAPAPREPEQRNNWNQAPMNRPLDRPASDPNRAVAIPSQPAGQNKVSSTVPLRPAAQNNVPFAAPDHPVAQNNGSVATPFRPVAQNATPSAPIRPVMPNNNRSASGNNGVFQQAQPVQNQFARDNHSVGGNNAFRGSNIPRDRYTTTPTVFRSLNMGNATPTEHSPRTPVQDPPQQNVSGPYTPPQVSYPSQQSFNRPVQQNSWAVPQNQFDGEAKTELLVEEAKTELLTEEPKTELLRESPFKDSDYEPKTELLSQTKPEPESAPEPEPKSEPESALEPEPKSALEPKPDPQTEPKGELLFKPDETAQTPEKEPPAPSVVINTAPKVGLLVCTKGENAGENFSLVAGRNRVGISENCDVRIKDDSLTEDYNFEIVYDERRENFTLVPGKLSSRLFINNDYVDSPIFLQPHDTIRTGNSAFLLVSFK